MDIEYKNASIRKVCTDASVAEKKYGKRMAEVIHQRIDQIRAVDTVEELIRYKIGRCHPLTGNRNGQYAMDLVNLQRLILQKKDNKIQVALILEIDDYH